MKTTTVVVLLGILLCSVVIADAQIFVYAKTCASCKAVGAKYCGYGSKGYVSCDGGTTITSCSACQSRFGRCVQGFITECYIG